MKEASVYYRGHLNTRGWPDEELGLACLGSAVWALRPLALPSATPACVFPGRPLCVITWFPRLQKETLAQSRRSGRQVPQGQGDPSVTQASGVKVPLLIFVVKSTTASQAGCIFVFGGRNTLAQL